MRVGTTKREEIMSNARCLHDFLEGQCGVCKPIPLWINKTVYTTKGGQVFHNWPDCAFLAEGQLSAQRRGQQIHPILPINWSEVFYSFGACEWCCALYHLRGKPVHNCYAYVNGKWEPALHIKERFTGYSKREHQVLRPETNEILLLSHEKVSFT